ncbi:hypothetical protein TNCV_2763811 [Trichonephila clavipes]|nr:hypothetical protein TNCV_2763811 [Trichonephila clavipes]
MSLGTLGFRGTQFGNHCSRAMGISEGSREIELSSNEMKGVCRDTISKQQRTGVEALIDCPEYGFMFSPVVLSVHAVIVDQRVCGLSKNSFQSQQLVPENHIA